jgi:hypothetical protein
MVFAPSKRVNELVPSMTPSHLSGQKAKKTTHHCKQRRRRYFIARYASSYLLNSSLLKSFILFGANCCAQQNIKNPPT